MIFYQVDPAAVKAEKELNELIEKKITGNYVFILLELRLMTGRFNCMVPVCKIVFREGF